MMTADRPRLRRGRHFFANPGPTNIPDSVLHAVAQAAIDFNDPAFLALYDRCVAGLKRLLSTTGEVFLYTGSGHAAWEAAMVNLFSAGDRLLVIESGYFSETWAKMAGQLGLAVEVFPADWRRGAALAALRERLAADAAHTLRAVCAVHNETSTGLTLPLPEIRAALAATAHPALLLADTISSLGAMPFDMDGWGVDVAIGAGQKGLMLPTGLSFTAVSGRAMAAHAAARLPKAYFNWSNMLTRRHRAFVGTVPTAFFFGLAESLRLLEEEGLARVFARHHRLAEAVRQAVRQWSSQGEGPQLFCLAPDRVSDSVTTVLMPPGYDAEVVRQIALEAFNVALGAGLGPLAGRVFRIGHLGDLNEPMVLGTLSAVEMALALADIPHTPGGVEAAMRYLAAAAAKEGFARCASAAQPAAPPLWRDAEGGGER